MKSYLSFLPTAFVVIALFFTSSCTVKNLDEDGLGSSFSEIQTNHTYTVDNVLDFDWIKGNSSWKQASESRLWSSKFTFRSNGEFIYKFDFDSSTSYTLRGDYFEDGNSYHFIGEYSVFNGGGSQQILVSGTVRPAGNGKFNINMEYGSSAYYGTVINEQAFYNQASKQFRTTMVIE